MKGIIMKRYKFIFLLTAFFSLFLTQNHFVFAQETAKQDWVSRYNGAGGPSNDQVQSIILDENNNIYLTAGIDPDLVSSDHAQFATFKFDPQGNVLWEKRFARSSNSLDTPRVLKKDGKGNIYVAGSTYTVGSNSEDYFMTMKYNENGDQLWTSPALYDGPVHSLYDSVSDMVIDSQGNIYVTGYSTGIGTGYDWAVVKYNPEGQEQWVARYNGSANDIDYPSRIHVDSQDNIYVVGYASATGHSADIALVKYDGQTGTKLWEAAYNGSLNVKDFGSDIAFDAQGNIYLVGYINGNSSEGPDGIVIKYDPQGHEQWTSIYSGSGRDPYFLNQIAVDKEGYVYAAGYGQEGEEWYNYKVVKLDPSDGHETWLYTYDGSSSYNDSVFKLLLDKDDNIYVTGLSSRGTYVSSNLYAITTVKLNKDGEPIWITSYADPEEGGQIPGQVKGMEIDTQGNVVLAGNFYDNDISFDIVLIKYSQMPTLTLDFKDVTQKVKAADTLKYTLTLTNNSSEPQDVFYWAKVRKTDGAWLEKEAVIPTPMTLEPNSSRDLTFEHTVPLTLRPGKYEYWGFVGPEAEAPWSKNPFLFWVTSRLSPAAKDLKK